MPVPAEWTQIGLPPPFETDHRRRVQRVAVRTVTSLANTHPLTFLAIRFFHGDSQRTMRSDERTSSSNKISPPSRSGL
jgi:hypothetical protein